MLNKLSRAISVVGLLLNPFGGLKMRLLCVPLIIRIRMDLEDLNNLMDSPMRQDKPLSTEKER